MVRIIFPGLLLLILLFNCRIQNAQTFPTNKKSLILWKSVNGVVIPVPPSERPRVLISPDQAAMMANRLVNPVIDPLTKELEKWANKEDYAKIEWDAIQYLVHGNSVLGRVIIDSTIAFLKRTILTDRNDPARVTGRAMVTGALVYDWLYSLITPSEKEIFIQELVRLAKTLECGYPPTKQGNIVGHSSESFIMRDMLAAGIAIYDEFPEMYELAATRFFGKMVPARNWLYKGHAYHQGDSYGVSRFNHEIVPNFIFRSWGIENVYDENQRYVPYYFLYSTRPDGSRMRSGDTFMHNEYKPGELWGSNAVNLLMASFYNDGVLMDLFLKQGVRSIKNNEYLFSFLWWDPAVQSIPCNTLPLSRYFAAPFGWMIARTGWDHKSVVAEMKINEYNFVNHQHLDAGTFQIYYRGPLAVESGLYTGTAGGYGSDHNKSYYWRTIAHNSLLIYNPAETFRTGYDNDGGQRLPNNRAEPVDLDALLKPGNGYKTGEVLAQDIGPSMEIPDYSYLKGDLTLAYSSKVSAVKRSFVFLNLLNDEVPAALIVYDKIISASPDFKKYWLLHSMEEPVINENETTITRINASENGKLINTTLLPDTDNLELKPIGGPGKEFWVFGTNYPNESNASSYERAGWRTELSPKTPANENYFLNIMQVMEGNIPKRTVKRIDGDVIVGTSIADRIVFFSKNSEIIKSDISFSFTGDGEYKILITDIAPGNWYIQKNGLVINDNSLVNDGKGTLYFTGTSGNYVLGLKSNAASGEEMRQKPNIYPNPFTSDFNVRFNFEVDKIRISDLTNKTMFSYPVELEAGGNTRIHPENLQPGMYILSGFNCIKHQSALLIKQ